VFGEVRAGVEEKVDDLNTRIEIRTKKMRYLAVYEISIMIDCERAVDRLCGLVVRVSGYRYRGLGFDPRRYQIL
jgi:hypothetical protein